MALVLPSAQPKKSLSGEWGTDKLDASDTGLSTVASFKDRSGN